MNLDKLKNRTISFETVDIDTVIQRLKITENKSNEPEEYEKALRDAFEFLGFRSTLIGGKGDTDVLLNANIGKMSYKVDVDGKTTNNDKVKEAQINWDSLDDHKKKNKSDYVILCGPGFAGGNLEIRAKSKTVGLLSTEKLIAILEAHQKYPFTLLELKDLFSGAGLLDERVEDLINQNSDRVEFLNIFETIIEEIFIIQNSNLGYFSFDSLAARDRIQKKDLDLEQLEDIFNFLRISFINCIKEVENDKYILTLSKNDLSNTFFQISNTLQKGPLGTITKVKEEIGSKKIESNSEKELGTKYFEWEKIRNSIKTTARKENPYHHSCPIEHFKSILKVIHTLFKEHKIINNQIIFDTLSGTEIADQREFKGKSESYKIGMVLGVLEMGDYIKWTGSLRPIEYTKVKNILELNLEK